MSVKKDKIFNADKYASSLLKKHFQIKVKPKNMEKFYFNSSNRNITDYLYKMIQIVESPDMKNNFKINEYNLEISDYIDKSVLEIDETEWKYQYEHKTITYQDTYDFLYLPEKFISFNVDKQTRGLTQYNEGVLISARHYIHNIILNKLLKYLDKKIPRLLITTYTEEENGMTGMNFTNKCGGYEKEYDIVYKYILKNIYDLNDSILDNIENIGDFTFLKRDKQMSSIIDNNYYIVGGKEAASQIKFNNFLADFDKLEQPYGIIEKIIKKVFSKHKKIIDNKIDNFNLKY
jgi:hypothetical protein